MKNSIKLVAALTACFLMSGIVWADDAEFRLVQSKNDMIIGGDFFVDLQIRITSGTSPRTLNSIYAQIDYSSAISEWGTAFPGTGWGIASDYDFEVVKNPGFYTVLVTGNKIGKTAEGVPPGTDITTSWLKIVTLRWVIASLTTVNVSINNGNDAAAYFGNYHNDPFSDAINWNVTNTDLGDVSLPVQMTNFTAQTTSREGVILNWTTESETNSAGFHIWRGESENAINMRVTNALIPSHGNSSSRNDYSFTDRSAHGKTFWYKIEEVSLGGQSQFLGPITVEAALPLPEQFSVSRNYPNPFNPETNIHYELPEDASVSVRVFDLMGREVKTLADGHMSAGRYDVKWDGTNHFGNAVSSGIYFVRVQAGEFSAVRKMTLMR